MAVASGVGSPGVGVPTSGVAVGDGVLVALGVAVGVAVGLRVGVGAGFLVGVGVGGLGVLVGVGGLGVGVLVGGLVDVGTWVSVPTKGADCCWAEAAPIFCAAHTGRPSAASEQTSSASARKNASKRLW